MDKLIDVSVWQGLIDWNAVYLSGITRAYIKCGGSDTGINYQDRNFVRNWQNSKSAGVKRGMYFFISSYTSFESQIDKIKWFNDTYPDSDYRLAIDLEDKSLIYSPKSSIISFFNLVESKLGYTPVVYTANWWFRQRFNQNDKSEWSKYPLWVASYTSTPVIPSGWDDYAIWQWTSQSNVNGITENTADMNWLIDESLITIPQKGTQQMSSTTAYVSINPMSYANVRNSPNVNSTANIVRKLKNGDVVKVVGNKTASGFYPIDCKMVVTEAEIQSPIGAPSTNLYVHSSIITFEKNNDNQDDPHIAGQIIYGMHDIPSQVIFKRNDRSAIIITLEMNQEPPTDKIIDLYSKGAKVIIRASWNYTAPCIPKNDSEISAMALWYKNVFSKIGKYVYAAHILNEPNLEVTPYSPTNYGPEYVAKVYNSVAKEIKQVAPNVLLSPPPLAWLSGVFDLTKYAGFLSSVQIGNSMYNALKYGTMHSAMGLMVNETTSKMGWVSGLETPSAYASRMWSKIEIKPDIFMVHTYDHGFSADPNQKFSDAPMTDVFYNIRNVENQLTAWQSLFGSKPRFGVSETNPCADARSPQNMRTDWFDRTFSYLDKIGAEFACYFRWENSPSYGVNYGMNGKDNLISSFIEAQK